LNAKLKANYIFLPFFIHTAFNVPSHLKIEAAMGFTRCYPQNHSGFFGGAAALSDITANTG
jgi:hypothetical protein